MISSIFAEVMTKILNRSSLFPRGLGVHRPCIQKSVVLPTHLYISLILPITTYSWNVAKNIVRTQQTRTVKILRGDRFSGQMGQQTLFERNLHLLQGNLHKGVGGGGWWGWGQGGVGRRVVGFERTQRPPPPPPPPQAHAQLRIHTITTIYSSSVMNLMMIQQTDLEFHLIQSNCPFTMPQFLKFSKYTALAKASIKKFKCIFFNTTCL